MNARISSAAFAPACAAALLAGACAATDRNDATAPLYEDVSSTHLPVDDLRGLSMDARPADLDGDGAPDLFLANRGTMDRLLLRRSSSEAR